MLSAKQWNVDEVVRLLMRLFLSLAATGLLVWGADAAAAGWDADQRKLFTTAVATVGFHGALLLLIAHFLRANGLGWRDAFGLRPQTMGRAVAWGAVAVLVAAPLNLGLMWVSREALTWLHQAVAWQVLAPVEQAPVAVLRTTTSLPLRALLGFTAIVLAPVIEELLFRGILYPVGKQVGYPRLALWGTALLFAFTHANLVTFLPLTAFAVLLTLLYERTDNLLAPMVTHSLFNTLNFAWLMTLPGTG